jgi:hypothetical protein
VLVAREGVEAEAEQALAVVGAQGGGREVVAEEGGAVVRVRVWTEKVVWAWGEWEEALGSEEGGWRFDGRQFRGWLVL